MKDRFALPLPLGILAAFVIAIITVLVIAVFTFRASEAREESATLVAHTFQVIGQLADVGSALKDLETGQRGFLLTSDENYLSVHQAAKAAVPGLLSGLRQLVSDNPTQVQRVDEIERLSVEKIAELDQTIATQRAGDAAGALSIVRSDRGRASMDRIRAVLADMESTETGLLDSRQGEWRNDVGFSAQVTWIGSATLIVLIIMAGYIMSRDFQARELDSWLKAGQATLSNRMTSDQALEPLGTNVLAFLSEYIDPQVGAVYVDDGSSVFRRVATHAIPAGDVAVVRAGDGLLGQAAKERRTLHIRDVPAGYLTISSALGQASALELLVVPAMADGVVHGVVELGFFRKVLPREVELLNRLGESLGVALRSSKDRSRLEELLAETQQQAEELQTQQEELRVGNEELEEQGRALKESQARLETQQAELEQTNAQLEEQAQLLEHQRDDLERSNQYKSEFLANMSHELRTPLNSSLILAKLLADNRPGNLTTEQIQFAQTISSAGNDLLALINDILDLSKIESGKVELQAETVSLSGVVDELMATFRPLAAEKELALEATLDSNVPAQIETDGQRLGQVLKNLLSNALKFTERGSVSLKVSSPAPGSVAFTVRDTGIGIAAHQLGIIFEAFRQADGSTHRQYGGTGLGLSISRDLAQLLGGDLVVQSQPGRGSAFTLTLPLTIPANAVIQRPADSSRTETFGENRPRKAARAASIAPASVDDDREQLSAGARVILVVEDDVPFAMILRDLAHEMGFKCVVTHSANDGLAAALHYRPSAILLDINLPDHSGLGVLDQLKRNPETRHIPVHVASVADYAREALELGAVGYALKPVKREELVDAFAKLESRLTQSLRHVLVVEDDARQQESIRQLLQTDEVKVSGAATAGEALTLLQSTTFDCVVMDLSLPDFSGYELLERMAQQDEVAFPPVIVYTGRSLSRDEEQRLRKFSKSIIIKDARSPERLLDEVTLFLHQVEAKLPAAHQRMLVAARSREAALEGRRILVAEDDVRNVFALSSVFEPRGATVQIARNGREAIDALTRSQQPGGTPIDLVLMDIMMPEMDGLTAMREIRKRAEWRRLPIIALTAKAMRNDQEDCLAAGANDYIAKPLDVEKLLSLVRVWMPK